MKNFISLAVMIRVDWQKNSPSFFWKSVRGFMGSLPPCIYHIGLYTVFSGILAVRERRRQYLRIYIL